MTKEARRDFDKDAKSWDENPRRIRLAKAVAEAIISAASSMREMDVLDFGCGTGLVTIALQPFVKTITGADSSRGMLDVLEEKARSRGLGNVRTRFLDVARRDTLEDSYDLIVSSMTLHHVPDIAGLLREWYGHLKPGGMVGLADLDREDGTFHEDNTGVFHFGFDRPMLKGILEETGFRELTDTTVMTFRKDDGDNQGRVFSVFLITARTD